MSFTKQEDLSVRKATVADAGDFAFILCESWKIAYKDILSPDELARNTNLEQRTARFRQIIDSEKGHLYLLHDKGKPCGFISFGNCRDDDIKDCAEIVAIYTLKEYWGKGIGNRLFNVGLSEIRALGYETIVLWVFEQNGRARSFYEKCGFKLDGISKDSDFGNTKEVRYIHVLTYHSVLIYGTGNTAKLASMRKCLTPLGIQVIGIKETGAVIPDVDESGNSPAENARIKAMTYYKAFQKPVFACDSGLYIDGLPDSEQPSVHVRRVDGKQLSDEEMVIHYSSIAKKMGGKVVARYKNAICLVISQDEIYEYFGDDISGSVFCLIDKPHPKRIEGFPLDCISIQPDSGEYYYWHKPNGDIGMTEIGFQNFFRRALRL